MLVLKKLCWVLIFIFSGTINALQIGDKAPNFVAQSTKGEINFHEWSENKWTILFSCPGDFTPVCTTELAELAFLQPEFKKRKTKIITLSTDSLNDHLEWVSHINSYKNKIRTNKKGTDLNYPIVSDKILKIATTYGMYHPKAEPSEGVFGNSNKSTIRSVFIIDPDNTIQTILSYPKHIGRNFNEIIRIIDALQLAKKYDVATPANWKKEKQVIVPTYTPSEDIKEKYNVDTFTVYQDYLRTINDPSEGKSIKSLTTKKEKWINFDFLPEFKFKNEKAKSKRLRKQIDK